MMASSSPTSQSPKSRREVIDQIAIQKVPSDFIPFFLWMINVIFYTDGLLQVRLGLRWSDVAGQIGLSKEWVTAACLGQMQLDEAEAEKVVGMLVWFLLNFKF